METQEISLHKYLHKPEIDPETSQNIRQVEPIMTEGTMIYESAVLKYCVRRKAV
jgi:hypothetical protein